MLLNRKSSSSNTGWKGIYKRPTTNKYEAHVMAVSPKCKSKRSTYKIHIGNFKTLTEAIQAREEFIAKLF